MTKPTPRPRPPHTDASSTQRIDKWLWYARFFKTRTLASQFVNNGNIRMTRGDQPVRIEKASTTIQGGDILSFMVGERVRIIQIIGCGHRRGPASEAQTLYEDQSPPSPEKPTAAKDRSSRDAGSGRPTKKDRRAIDALRTKG